MSSGASVYALQRLVEQLRPAWRGSRSLRRLLSFSSTARRMPARMPCWSEFQRVATPSGSPDPVLYSEDWKEVC
ncbi:unnamed protein product [Pipistrellus nathusii]|uniref:Uncharacterized protein n=1 Tax=Pipistrellus nathusii TaxID=59473 RepID=A0ABP0AGX3_PIPNA